MIRWRIKIETVEIAQQQLYQSVDDVNILWDLIGQSRLVDQSRWIYKPLANCNMYVGTCT